MDESTLITDQRNPLMLKMLWLIAIITCLLDLVSGTHYSLFQYLIMLMILVMPTLLLKGTAFARGIYILSAIFILYFGLRLFWQPSLINLLSLYLGVILLIIYQNPALILTAGLAATLVSMGVFHLQHDGLVSAVKEMQDFWFAIPGLVLTGLMLVLNRFFSTKARYTSQSGQWHNIQNEFDVITWSYDIESGRLLLSRAAEELIGLPVDWLMKQPQSVRKLVHPYDSLRLLEAYKDLLAGRKRILEHRLLLANGSTKWVHNLAIPIRMTGKTIRIDGLIIDISEQKMKEEIISHMAFHDQLTGLPNRTMFENFFSLALAGERNKEKKAAVIFIDLDDFKRVNDEMGHDVGDILLKEAGTRVKNAMRESDLLARLGGDEFAALLTSVSTERTALVAKRILESFAHCFTVGGHELHVGASIGISLYPKDGKDLEILLKKADDAMYTAKKKGKNQYSFYTD